VLGDRDTVVPILIIERQQHASDAFVRCGILNCSE
jgi:hypothetical protein